MAAHKKQVAVVLCGSGYKDGSEIRESVGTLWALSACGAQASCFALDEPQFDVVNCLTGEPLPGEKRNQQIEAARIARGSVQVLSKLDSQNFDAVIFPGGFGAAKNLCTFAQEGAKGHVHPEVQRVLDGFRQAKKPIGAICIAPAILALAFPHKNLELTLGEEGEATQEIVSLGHRHIVKKAHEFHWDSQHQVASTPAYMYEDAPLHEIFEGILGLTKTILANTASSK